MKATLILLLFSAASAAFGQNVQTDTLKVTDTTQVIRDTTAAMKPDTGKTVGQPEVSEDTTALQPTPAVRVDTARIEPEKLDTTMKEVPEEDLSAASKRAALDPGGYKDVHWGMTLQEVREHLLDRDNINEYDVQPITNGFEYDTPVAGVKATVSYQFDNDRLFIVRVTPAVKAQTKFDFIDSFEEYQNILVTKYGKPTRTGFHKMNEEYLSTIESIQLGVAKKYALWEFDRSYVVLVLAGKNGRLEIHITYVSRLIFEEMQSRKEVLKVEDF